MYVCMYVCMYVSMYVFMYLCIYVCKLKGLLLKNFKCYTVFYKNHSFFMILRCIVLIFSLFLKIFRNTVMIHKTRNRKNDTTESQKDQF